MAKAKKETEPVGHMGSYYYNRGKTVSEKTIQPDTENESEADSDQLENFELLKAEESKTDNQ